MKVKIDELDGQFRFNLEAESPSDVGLLARLCINVTREIPEPPYLCLTNEPFAWVFLGCSKNRDSIICKEWKE